MRTSGENRLLSSDRMNTRSVSHASSARSIRCRCPSVNGLALATMQPVTPSAPGSPARKRSRPPRPLSISRQSRVSASGEKPSSANITRLRGLVYSISCPCPRAHASRRSSVITCAARPSPCRSGATATHFTVMPSSEPAATISPSSTSMAVYSARASKSSPHPARNAFSCPRRLSGRPVSMCICALLPPKPSFPEHYSTIYRHLQQNRVANFALKRYNNYRRACAPQKGKGVRT